jgi:hypothetical protein
MTLEFSYTFDPGDTTQDLLTEAHDTVRVVGSPLAGGARGAGGLESTGAGDAAADPARDAALRLLAQLRENVAELAAAEPDLLPLSGAQLQASGGAAAPVLQGLGTGHQFYWLRIPYTLQPRADHRFDRLELAIELNPGAGARRPRILSALPASEFVTVADATTELSIGIDEGLQFSVAAGGAVPGGDAAAAHVAAHGSARLGFVAGPFHYRVRKAVIERGPLPSERVFWRISQTETLSEAPPELIAVIAVPDDVERLEVAAALQAYASGAILTMSLGDFLSYLGDKFRRFFTSGAPARSTRTWDLTRRLVRRA